MASYIDVHAHINPATFPAAHPTHSLDSILARARAANISAIVSVSENLTEARDILALSEQYQGFVWPSAGVHPVQVTLQGERSIASEDVEEMLGYLREVGGRIVAIGEGERVCVRVCVCDPDSGFLDRLDGGKTLQVE